MNAPMNFADGPLALRVKEPSLGLFYWVVTQLSPQEFAKDIKINESDHPYPTHEAAFQAGQACLRALKAPASTASI